MSANERDLVDRAAVPDENPRSLASEDEPVQIDVAVVGAGFAGLYALYRLRALGLQVKAFEAGDDVGGVWYWNKYPGARCDTNSLFYCYSFSDELRSEWAWTERFPARSELQAYLSRVADRFDLRKDISFSTRILRVTFDDTTDRWSLQAERGPRASARFCVLALGCLTDVQFPDVPGLEDFAGEFYHTARWPEPEPDLHGQTVGVIGTGSSGVQIIPEIADRAERLVVFQRTANYVLPARNAPLEPEFVTHVNDNYAALRETARASASGVPLGVTVGNALDYSASERERIYQQRWNAGGVTEFLSAFDDVRSDLRANATAADFVRHKIREIVTNPVTAEILCPTLPFGAKRTPLGHNYYETFNRDNVDLVDIHRAPIKRADANGLWVGDVHHRLTRIVFATGFDAFTGALFKINITGRDGHVLREDWAEGPRTYLGLAAADFPNLFIINGPGSPSVLGNVVVAIEQHVEWLTDLFRHLIGEGISRVQASKEAQDRWSAHVREVGSKSIIATGNAWYLGANVPGKPRVVLPYAGGYGTYRKLCDEVAGAGYKGFELTRR